MAAIRNTSYLSAATIPLEAAVPGRKLPSLPRPRRNTQMRKLKKASAFLTGCALIMPRGSLRIQTSSGWRFRNRDGWYLTASIARLNLLSMHIPDWAWMIVFVLAWLVVTQWLLPKLGVPT